MEYNKHYILVNASGCVIDGWSDGVRPYEDTTAAVCVNENGGLQFKLFPDGVENPALFDAFYMVPFYKFDGEKVLPRTAEEVGADISAEQTRVAAEEARAARDRLLAETDWTQTLDAPISTASKEAFRVYRQMLRDVPQQAGYPFEIAWPTKPGAVKADPEPVDTVVDAIIGEEGLE
jgi:hypothetical protein